ncbi:MAG: TolC family protein [Chlamydiia bacterium]|nr:TolC family protein [Chlamydiia bacterium]
MKIFVVWLSLGAATLLTGEEIALNRLSLSDAETLALDCNKQFLIAKEGTLQALERKLQAVSRWLPSIHYSAELRGTQKKEDFFNLYSATKPFIPSHTGYSSLFQLDQPLFSTDLIFGLKSKALEAESYRCQQANTKNELLLAVRQSYYAVVSLDISLQIQRVNIDYLSYALNQEQGKLDAGNSTPYEVNQSKVVVANAISSYYTTLRDLKNARNAFVLTLGIDPLLEPKIQLSTATIPLLSIPEIARKLHELEIKYSYPSDTFPTTEEMLAHIDRIEALRELTVFSEKEVQQYLDLAISLRPDLHTQKLQIGVAEQNLHAKQGHYLPKITGYIRFGYNDNQLGPQSFGSEAYHWVGGMNLSWNLFDSFLREHEVREAKSMKQSSRISYEKEFQKIEVEIRNGLYQLEETMLAYLSSSQGVFLAEQARLQAQEKLEFGRIAPLEYRDSVNLLAIARNQLNRASFELIAAYYQLRYAIGLDTEEL